MIPATVHQAPKFGGAGNFPPRILPCGHPPPPHPKIIPPPVCSAFVAEHEAGRQRACAADASLLRQGYDLNGNLVQYRHFPPWRLNRIHGKDYLVYIYVNALSLHVGVNCALTLREYGIQHVLFLCEDREACELLRRFGMYHYYPDDLIRSMQDDPFLRSSACPLAIFGSARPEARALKRVLPHGAGVAAEIGLGGGEGRGGGVTCPKR